MSHELKYYDFGETKDIRKDVTKVIDKMNAGVGSNYDYWQGLSRIGDRKFNCYEDACKFLDDAPDYIVPYYETIEMKSNKLKKLNEKKNKLEAMRKDLQANGQIKYSKIGNVICPTCNSRINPKYVKNNTCPVCSSSMLNPKSKAKLDKFNTRIKDLEKEISTELKNSKVRTGKIRWLDLIDMHS